MEKILKNNDGIKRRKYDNKILKAMIVPDGVFQNRESYL